MRQRREEHFMAYRILTLSPGSTSTKVAVFEGDDPVFKANVRHDPAELASRHGPHRGRYLCD